MVNIPFNQYMRDGNGASVLGSTIAVPRATPSLYEAASSSWTVAQKLGGATHVVRPSVAVNDNFQSPERRRLLGFQGLSAAGRTRYRV